MLNDLHAAMMKGQGKDVAGSLLRKLLSYTRDHFAAEEAMMTAAKYPGLTQHCILHRNLTKQVEEFVERYEQGASTLSLQLMTFLSDWLTNHIQKTDKEYGPCLRQHGMQ